jgi:Family of unknown function (DUF6247)
MPGVRSVSAATAGGRYLGGGAPTVAGLRDGACARLRRGPRDFGITAVGQWAHLCWSKRRPLEGLPMTTPHARQPQVLPRPACTPAAIRAVLAANADYEVLQRYDADLDATFERARAQGDLTPLVQTVRRWWFEADAWRDLSGSTGVPGPCRHLPKRGAAVSRGANDPGRDPGPVLRLTRGAPAVAALVWRAGVRGAAVR